MSQDRDKVFQTTRVRTTLKNDLSWIHKPKGDKKEPDNARTDQAVETRPVVVRQSSYVLSAAKKFESVDPPLSPPLQNTQFTPSGGNAANKANGEVIPSQEDAQPEESTLETRDDTKPQAPTEELIQNGEAQPENSVANTTAENKEDTAANKSNVEHNEGAAELSADIHIEEHIPNGEAQPESSTNENPEAVPPVEPAEQSVADTTENKADITVDQSNVEHTEGAAEVSADVHVKEHILNGEAQPESSTNENPEAVPPVEPAEQPVADTTAENKADTAVDQSNVDADVKSPAETSAAAGTEKSEDTAAEVPAADAGEPQKESSAETEPATATDFKAAGTESTVQPAEQAAEEIVEAVAAVVVESSPVINTTPGEEAALQDSVKSVPDLLAESGTETPAQPAAESATECSPSEDAAGETVEAVAEVTVESSPETAAVTNAAGEEVAPQDSVEPVPDLVAGIVPESPAELAAETAVTSVEYTVTSAASAEPVLQTTAEEVVKSEVQPANNAVVEQSVEPTPVMELSIEDALEPVTASDDKVADRAIELTDALDLEPPAAEVAPEPQKDPEQSHTEETTLNHQPDHTNTSDISQKPVEEQQSTESLYQTRDGKSVCAFCDKTIDGKVKIIFSEPLVTYHPDCLQCGVCAMALGDLLTPMFLHNQVIQCDGCFAKALKT